MLSVPKAASTERRFSEKQRRRLGMSFDLKSSPPVRQPLMNPKTVERVAQARLPTEFGEFRIIGYRSLTSKEEFVVLAQGELNVDQPTLVRIHSQCMTGDVFMHSKAQTKARAVNITVDSLRDFRIALLPSRDSFRNYAASNSIPGVSGWISLHVVCLRVNDQRSAAVGENRVTVRTQVYPRVS